MLGQVQRPNLLWGSYWKPMYVCRRIKPIKVPSRRGFKEPTANGAMVIGMRPIETSLYDILNQYLMFHPSLTASLSYLSVVQ